MIAIRVQSERHLELLRLVRNRCSGTYAHNNAEISKEQQSRWWAGMRWKVMAWLFAIPGRHDGGYRDRGDDGVVFTVVGYGMLRQARGLWWSSVGVLSEFAGRGYGKEIIARIIRMGPSTVYGEALLTNPGGVKVHDAADWDEVYRDDRIVRFRTKDGLR